MMERLVILKLWRRIDRSAYAITPVEIIIYLLNFNQDLDKSLAFAKAKQPKNKNLRGGASQVFSLILLRLLRLSQSICRFYELFILSYCLVSQDD
jgi:hypothetical protein